MVRRRFVGLNGLKGIALIAIVLYHCDQGTLRGGFLGVDIFFTISGFLIFSSLLNHIDSGKGIGFKEYYLKRLHRIYPALILMIPVTVSLAWFINQDMLVDINNQIVTAMLGCYNWYAIGSGASYFSQMNPDMFRHLWFMSVLYYGSAPAGASYFAISNGMTEASENVWGTALPYLVAVDSSTDLNADNYLYTVQFTTEQMQQALGGLGLLPDLAAPASWFGCS